MASIGLEGLVKGMERKLELKEMVIKVGWLQIVRSLESFSCLKGKESELELLKDQGKSSESTPILQQSPAKRTFM